MTGGYKERGSFAQVDNVNNFALANDQSASRDGTNVIYGKTMSQNFTVELTGYFLAPYSGQYKFSMSIDDSAILQLGSGVAFPCCNADGQGTSGNAMFAHWDGPNKVLGSDTRVYTLEKGGYYPIKMVYINSNGPIVFSVSASVGAMEIPISDYMYSFENLPDGCPRHVTTITTPWSESIYSTTTIDPIDPDGTTTVEIFAPPHITSITLPWSGSTTRATTITPSNSDGTTIVEVLTPTKTPSSTIPESSSSTLETSSSTLETSSTVSKTSSSMPELSSSIPETYSTSAHSSSSLVESSSLSIETSSTPVSSSLDPASTSFDPTDSFSQETVTIPSTTVITVTTCSDAKCTVLPVTTGQKVVTATVDNTVTSYITYCPLPTTISEIDVITKISTTIITVTFCSDNECTDGTDVTVTTGEMVVTTTVNSKVTVYTTYCPLPSDVPVKSNENPIQSSPVTSCNEDCRQSPSESTETVVPSLSCNEDECTELFSTITKTITTTTSSCSEQECNEILSTSIFPKEKAPPITPTGPDSPINVTSIPTFPVDESTQVSQQGCRNTTVNSQQPSIPASETAYGYSATSRVHSVPIPSAGGSRIIQVSITNVLITLLAYIFM